MSLVRDTDDPTPAARGPLTSSRWDRLLTLTVCVLVVTLNVKSRSLRDDGSGSYAVIGTIVQDDDKRMPTTYLRRAPGCSSPGPHGRLCSSRTGRARSPPRSLPCRHGPDRSSHRPACRL